MSFLTFWRLLLLVLCLVSFFLLIKRFKIGHKSWDTKTLDYWFALLLWTFAAILSTVESLIRHLPGRYSIVVTTTAAMVTLTGALRPGIFGVRNEKK